jgi:hypothetical protein
LHLSVLQTVVRRQNAGSKLLSVGASLLQPAGNSEAPSGQYSAIILAIQETPEWLRPAPASCLRPIDKTVSSNSKRNGDFDVDIILKYRKKGLTSLYSLQFNYSNTAQPSF